MRILVLGKYYPPYRGGIETLTRNWCEGFARLGAEVECVVANDRPRGTVSREGALTVRRCARIGTAFSTPLCPGYPFAPRQPADVIQAHFPNPLADLALLRIPRHLPLVLTYHSDIIRHRRLLRLYRPLLHWLLRRADQIVVATPPQLEHSAALAAHRAKCAIIPFGLDLGRFDSPAAPSPRVVSARAAAGAKPVFLYVGRLVGYKGLPGLLEALPSVEGITWLVGSGPLAADLEARAAAAGLADRIRFWGEVDDAELPGFFHACDVFVLPSITPHEAFGLVQVEAMACGKPVVSCRLPSGVPYVNQDGITGRVVPPGDPVALAAALRELGTNPGLRRTLGEAGRHRARAEFSLDVMVGRYWNLFERLTVPAGPG